MIIEKILQYGEENRLTGIITLPKEVDKLKGKPGIILLNAGILHKVGPYRLHVEIARALGKKGYPTLRFDLTDLGDSSSHISNRGNLTNNQYLDDIGHSIEIVNEKYMVENFVLIGLCSGAAYAHKYMVKDSRVAGGIFLDGYGYRTWKYCLYRSIELLSFQRISKYFERVAKILNKKKTVSNDDSRERLHLWTLPPKKRVESDLLHLISRNSKLLYIYSRGAYTYYNYHSQFQDMFKSPQISQDIDWHFFPHTDHLYINTGDRKQLIQLIEQWILKQSF